MRKLAAAGELFRQLFLDDQLVGAPTDSLNGLLDGRHIDLLGGVFFARLAQASESQGILADSWGRSADWAV